MTPRERRQSSPVTDSVTMELEGCWDLAELPGNVVIGAGTWIERRASFEGFRSERDPGLVLGHRVRAYTATCFNVEPPGRLEVGDDCVLVGALFMVAGHVRLGRGVEISYGVTISDADFHPHDPDRRRRDAVALAPDGDPSRREPYEPAPVTIDDHVRIGIGAIILKGVHIGARAQIGAGAVVTGDVPQGATVVGNPGRVVESPGRP
jgi:acetyltransferase-like isoleucine patch superfamily enzyme